MRDLIKNYFLGTVVLVLYIPRLLLTLILLLLPAYIIPSILFLVIFPDVLQINDMVEFSYIERLSSIEQLVFATIGLMLLFKILDTKYGEIIERVCPVDIRSCD